MSSMQNTNNLKSYIDFQQHVWIQIYKRLGHKLHSVCPRQSLHHGEQWDLSVSISWLKDEVFAVQMNILQKYPGYLKIDYNLTILVWPLIFGCAMDKALPIRTKLLFTDLFSVYQLIYFSLTKLCTFWRVSQNTLKHSLRTPLLSRHFL